MIIGSIFPLILMFISNFITINNFDILLSKFQNPQYIEWIYILAMGFFATISQLLMTKAYEYSKAGIIGTISYSNIIFATIIGIILGDNIPNIWTIIGIILVIISGILVTINK
jgi:drug/metabolite transporter (DMT)-like permease